MLHQRRHLHAREGLHNLERTRVMSDIDSMKQMILMSYQTDTIDSAIIN